MDDSELVSGLYPKKPHGNAPDFVIGKLSINVEQFRDWMKSHLSANQDAEWINLDMKLSKADKGYAVVDTWKPDAAPAPKPVAAPEPMAAPEDIPF